MGIIQNITDKLGVGRSQEERLADAVKDVSDAYPNTPEGTYRCAECGEIKGVLTIGNTGMEKTEEGVDAAAFCESCTTVV